MDAPFAHPFDYGPHRGPMDREDRRTRMVQAVFAILVAIGMLSYLTRLG